MDSVLLNSSENEKLTVSLSKLFNSSNILNEFIEKFPICKYYIIFYLMIFAIMAIIFSKFIKKKDTKILFIQNRFELYIYGKEYSMTMFQQFGPDFTRRFLNIINVCSIHDFACEQNNYDLQFICWKLFDEYWKGIFQMKDFLYCKETTITSLISRAIYSTLDELNLFYAVDDWINAKITTEKHLVKDINTIRQRRKELMRPFLPKLRLLAIAKDDMQNMFDMLALLLTEHEMRAIRDFFSSQDYPNADLSDFPETLCNNTLQRNMETYDSLFEYNNKSKSPIGKEIYVTRNTQFACNIFVKEDCFLADILLPVYFSHTKTITMNLNISKNGEENSVQSCQFECNNIGEANLSLPPFLKKNSVYHLSSKFSEDEEMDIRISPNAYSFITDEEKSDKSKKEKNEKDANNFYFEVYLYF
ncbi:uncharacterized protein LOC111631313 [Centruroides sculpturatus]|uniref:uncharacterized protein LOC111631313 n=1 Tax=Centruroides sculpturatus TaxID=218467 RepID=UPI000C6E0C59|nr:uncharacterized protein LOC111631313 [Centruroides sculpturatus]